MSSNKTLSVLLLTVFFPILAWSSFFIEPSLGYRTHVLKMTSVSATLTQTNLHNISYGIKTGYRSLSGIDVNLAYDYYTGKAKIEPPGEESNFTHSTGALQLGVNALAVMKIYLGYGFTNELKIDDGVSAPGMTLNGQAYQAGLQFRIFRSVALGLQYNLNQFKTIKGNNFTSGDQISTYFDKIDSQDYSISVSTSF